MIFLRDEANLYASQLLKLFDCAADINHQMDHPALSWRRSGLQGVTGAMAPVAVTSAAEGALLALKALSANPEYLPRYGAALLGERALMLNYACKGASAANGFAKLLEAKDGYIALNMARKEDWEVMPALFERKVNDWAGIKKALKSRDRSEIIERGIELGLAIAMDTLPPMADKWYHITSFDKGKIGHTPLVIDLSAMWAGPITSSLLTMCGARVIKVESPHRLDGMRAGHKAFYNLINERKETILLSFNEKEGWDHLSALLDKADIVIEASRPRALRQLGIYAENFVARDPGKIWVRMTAYGHQHERIGFGDDIAISAGAAQLMRQAHGVPQFMGDALADPVSGLHAAVAVMAIRAKGGGAILDINMQRVMRYAFGFISTDIKELTKEWTALADSDKAPFYPRRYAREAAAPPGAHTSKILAELC